MDDYRAEFPVLEQWTFMNHASVAPLSRRARKRLDDWTEDATINGNVHEAAWFAEIEGYRRSAARMIHAKPDEIAFLKNTSEGLALIAEGFPWKAGDNVVIAEGEYPANVYPWMNLKSRGVEVRTCPVKDHRIDPADVQDLMDERTRVLSISIVQFNTGFRSDLERLGALCHRLGIDFCVDAIQGLGVIPIDVDAMRIDYLSADGHKWLVSPMGASVMYINQSKLDKIRSISVGWKSVAEHLDFSTIDFRLKPSASRHEEGSPNVPGILALGQNIEWFLGIGIERIQERVKLITDYAIDLLRSKGAEIASPRDGTSWSGIVSFTLPNADPVQVVRRCREAGVVVGARGGRLRISPHFYNSPADVDRAVAEMMKNEPPAAT